MRKKDVFELIGMGLIAVLVLVLFTGCSSFKIEKEFDPTGQVVIKETKTVSGFVTANKSINEAGQVKGVKVESTGGTSTGTMMPNVLAADSQQAYQSSPAFTKGETNPPMYIKAKQSSFLDKISALFGITASGEIEAYTGVAGESAAETKARLEAFRAASADNSTSQGTPVSAPASIPGGAAK